MQKSGLIIHTLCIVCLGTDEGEASALEVASEITVSAAFKEVAVCCGWVETYNIRHFKNEMLLFSYKNEWLPFILFPYTREMSRNHQHTLIRCAGKSATTDGTTPSRIRVVCPVLSKSDSRKWQLQILLLLLTTKSFRLHANSHCFLLLGSEGNL